MTGVIAMRTIYENYRGFKVYHDDKRYEASNESIHFSEHRLSEILNRIDKYVEHDAD
jgi:hypothetical protein